MNLRRFAPAAVLVALLALSLGIGVASAKNASFGSQVTIDKGGPTGAEGHVSSSQPKCLRGRHVTLYVVDSQTGELLEIDDATSDGKGNWDVNETLFAGDYVATVDGKQVKVGKKRRSCRSDRSPRKHL